MLGGDGGAMMGVKLLSPPSCSRQWWVSEQRGLDQLLDPCSLPSSFKISSEL